jgi:hypothetical protein
METTSLNKIVWHIAPLLGKDLKTNETTAVAMQRSSKHASTIVELLLETVLCNLLLGSCNSWTTTVEMGEFRCAPCRGLILRHLGQPT